MDRTNVLLAGASGVMGGKVVEAAKRTDDVSIVAGLDVYNNEVLGFPVRPTLEELQDTGYNTVLDFSKPQALGAVLWAATARNTPLVIATTGYSPEQNEEIEEMAKKLAIFKSTNFSMGVFKWVKAAAALAAAFKDNPEVDIEVIEAHHNRKADGPSGTAKTVAEMMLKARGWDQIADRTPDKAKRQPGDIGMSFIRGGNVPGYHEVWFCSPTGEIKLSEREYGREGFAAGALEACKFMQGKQPNGRIYTMDDLIASC